MDFDGMDFDGMDFDGMDLNSAIKAMDEIKFQLDEINERRKELNKAYDFLRTGKVPELMDDDGVSTITIKGLGRVTLTSDVYASIPAAMRETAHDWLRDHGYGALVKETVNASSLKAFAKEELKNGRELPEEIFKITPFSRASITKK